MSDLLGPWFCREGLGLLTDFYELTMMAGHVRDGRCGQRASFDYFFRSLPPHTGFAVTAGLNPFLDYLERLRFQEEDLRYLRSLQVFEEGFLDYLRDFRPSCTVHALPEGTLAFPHAPVAVVEGLLCEVQLIETALLNLLNHQTLIATKAARVCLAAEGDPVMEFGLRRAHGPDGGLSGSRAAYIGGCSSTSNVLAGRAYGIPVSGTHAHSWVMAFPSELEAFRAFARHYPEKCTLLVDTYDTVNSGVPHAIQVFQEMRAQGLKVRPAIRLDSGDLAKLSKIAWNMLREAGFEDPIIVASNDLDEDLIADLKRQGAKINAWGVGTHLITAYDAPALNGVYKLSAINNDGEWQPRMKVTSNPEKATDPGRKQLVRYADAQQQPVCDVLYLREEEWPRQGPLACRSRLLPHRESQVDAAVRGEALFHTVFQDGRRVEAAPAVADIRAHALEQIQALPEEYKRLRNPEIYRVYLSPRLGAMKDAVLSGERQA